MKKTTTKLIKKQRQDAVKSTNKSPHPLTPVIPVTPHSVVTPVTPKPTSEGLTQHRPGLDAYGQRRSMDIPKSILSQNPPAG